MNVRKLYEKHHGKIQDGYEIHHIVPRFAGGTDDISNLVCVSPIEHAKLHYLRYEEFGDFRDLCSYYMIGYNFSEAHKISSSEGGKIGGKKTYEMSVGIFRDDNERLEWARLGGKKGSLVQMENKIGIHTDDKELKRKWASLGGKKGAFTNSEIQSELGKRGGVKNKGFVWLNDGKNELKYTTTMQEELPIHEFMNSNPSYTLGRIIQRIECPHCQKVGNKPAMMRHHFNNCKNKGTDENQINH